MSQRSPFQRFLRELRRRHVPQTAAVYLVAGWAAIEFADVVVPNLNGPPWVVTAVIVAALVGLPITLILAWIFDWGPEGLYRTGAVPEAGPDVSVAEGPTRGETAAERGTGSAPWMAAVAVLVVSIGSALAVAAVISGGVGGGADAEGEGRAPTAGARGPGDVRRPDRPPVLVPGDAEGAASALEELADVEALGDLDLSRLDDLRELGRMGSGGHPELVDIAVRMAQNADRSVLVSDPPHWRLGVGGAAPLPRGDTLLMEGVAVDSAGVASVRVEGVVVAESVEGQPDDALPFEASIVGTGSSGVREVEVVVRTVDGREISRTFRIIQVPGGR